MQTILHPLVRPHIIEGFRKGFLPINADDNTGQRIGLHLNTNYNADSNYKYYPIQNNEIYERYINFLNSCNSKVHLINSNISFISASEAINLIIRVFCEPQQDKICILSPTYPLYGFCANIHNVHIVDVRLYGPNFEYINVHEILTHNPKVIFIPRPNNPIGSIIEINSILKLLDNFNGLLVIDEAYIEYSDSESLVGYINQYKNNLIIIRSFSKIWGLAGIRCGVIIADDIIVRSLESIQMPFTFPSHTQNILMTYLAKTDYIKSIKEENIIQKEKLTNALSSLQIVKKIYKSHANFIAVEFINGQEIFNYLMKNDIIVRDIQKLLPNTLRISLGTSDNNKYLIQKIRNYCNQRM